MTVKPPDDDPALTDVQEAANGYARRHWSVVPVPFRSKVPVLKQWQQLRLKDADLAGHFHRAPQNVGVLLGEPSGWLIDVDLDHLLAVELASQFLPPTQAIFGRPGKASSHYLYISTGPCTTKKFKSPSGQMIVEFRSTGQQTVFPPSTHESGEPIRWVTEHCEPSVIDPIELLDAVKQLSSAVQSALGDKATPLKTKCMGTPKPSKPIATQHPSQSARGDDAGSGNVDKCLQAMLRLQISDNKDGSSRLYACACRVVEHDLDDSSGLAVIEEYSRQHPFPRAWSPDEMLQRIRDAEKVCERGTVFLTGDDGCVKLGRRDPVTGRFVLSSRRTLPTAEAFVREFHSHDDGRTLFHYAGSFWEWRGNRYAETEDGCLSQHLLPWLHNSLRYIDSKRSGEPELVPFEANPATLGAALESIRTYRHLPASTPAPHWLSPKASDPPANELLVCRRQIWHLPSGRLLEPTPRLFTFHALEFDLDENAPVPVAWFTFLHQLFDGDLEAHDLLQEWFGYCLIADTSQQKMLLMVGPKRSGKGTIARLLRHLVGLCNVCGPTISSLAGPFGLQPLLARSLAIVSDARFHGDYITTVVERLLCISGEDMLTVDRKHKDSVTVKLPTRFLFLTNELPRFADASGALAGRFLMLQLTKSFYGKEDHQLERKLVAELPGILNWAIEGWHRLHQRNHFIQPQSAAESLQDLENLGSPVKAFVGECCVVKSGLRIDTPDLFDLWRRWCERVGREHPGTHQTFGRDLQAAFPEIKCRRKTDNKRFYDGVSEQ